MDNSLIVKDASFYKLCKALTPNAELANASNTEAIADKSKENIQKPQIVPSVTDLANTTNTRANAGIGDGVA